MEGRHKSIKILWPQLSNRSSHNGNSERHGGLSYKDIRNMVKCSLSPICANPKEPVGNIFQTVVL